MSLLNGNVCDGCTLSLVNYPVSTRRTPDNQRISTFQAASNKAEESFLKLPENEAQAVQGRLDVIAYASLAEINHFNQHRVGDFKIMMQNYLQQQITHYQNVS